MKKKKIIKKSDYCIRQRIDLILITINLRQFIFSRSYWIAAYNLHRLPWKEFSRFPMFISRCFLMLNLIRFNGEKEIFTMVDYREECAAQR